MFRSDKKQNDKRVAEETGGNQISSPSWQHNAQPVEQPATAAVAAPMQSPTQPRAIGEREAMARDIKDGVLNGFVGNGTVMSGEAVFKGMLRVDGNLTGRVSSEDGTLLVGTNGQVDANIKVSVATIHGAVNGDIVATKRIELGRSARVVGNIQTPALVIEQGAVFEGSCLMLAQGKEKSRDTTPGLIAPTGELSEVSDISDIAS